MRLRAHGAVAAVVNQGLAVVWLDWEQDRAET